LQVSIYIFDKLINIQYAYICEILTLSIPDDLHEKMKSFKDLKWTQIIREMIERKLKELEEGEYRLYSLTKLQDAEAAEDLFEF
jgi:predicted CopG family antitoxin